MKLFWILMEIWSTFSKMSIIRHFGIDQISTRNRIKLKREAKNNIFEMKRTDEIKSQFALTRGYVVD